MQKISAKLLRVEKLASDVYEFEFASEGAIGLEPGQFMLLNVPASEDGALPPVSRAYSIASPPGGNLQFCIKLIPGGRGSEYLRGLEVGDSVELQGPSGHFTLSSSAPGKDLIFVATGVGVAPFMCMLKQMFAKAEEHPARSVLLHFGVRHEEDVFYKEQLEAWQAAHPNFDFKLTLSQPSEEWTGDKGRVTGHLAEQFKGVDPAQTEIFICGSGAMVKEVKTMAEEKGFDRPAIHFELFTPVVAK